MSAIVFLVWVPAIVLGVALLSLLLGAATAGVWETLEHRQQADPNSAEPGSVNIAPRQGPRARAA
jgi:sterol desaturase/sphingolipid hydroxylase (fatty acid hydroxylase superfamily)